MTYAANTKVSPERSRAEIEGTLMRYGADAFSYGWEEHRAVIAFRAQGRMIRMNVPVPPLDDFRYTRGHVRRTSVQMRSAQEQAVRQRWRALALIVKAKLEAVASGVVTFEEEFMAHILLPDGRTVGEWAGPQLEEVYATGSMPSLLPASRQALAAGEES